MERLAAIERRHHMDAHVTTSEENSPSPGKRRHVQTIIIGLSGPSSSGKTTLARLLREIFNLETPGLTLSLAILHQDDSYKTDKDVPTVTVSSETFGTRDLQDWDCVGSLDLPLFEHTLTHLLEHGALPWDSVSKEDQNSVGESHVSKRDVEAWKERMTAWLDDLAKKTHPAHPSSSTSGSEGKGDENDHEDGSNNNREVRIYIVDGFLLYPRPPPTSASAPASASGAPSTTATTSTSTTSSPHSPEELNRLYALTHSVMHPKLFIPSTRDQTLARRAARSGYVTLEGFWTDPPGYVEDLVWPNYIRYHSWMYAGGNVDAEVFDEAVCAREGISVCPGGGHWNMHQVLEWAVGRVKEAVEEKV